MSTAALMMARVAIPGIQQKLVVWSLWVCKRREGGESSTQDGEAQLEGSKEPVRMRGRRRPFRRGRRGHRAGARNVKRGKRPVATTHPEKASRRKGGGGSRRSHFVSAFERSAERLVKTSLQCLDIKSRAKARELEGKVPLPPRAKAGLARRQTSLRHASVFWGDAWAKANGTSREAGRRCWRDLLHRLADVAHDEDVSSWKDTASVIGSELAAVEEEKAPFPGVVRGPFGGWVRADGFIATAGTPDAADMVRTKVDYSFPRKPRVAVTPPYTCNGCGRRFTKSSYKRHPFACRSK
jgi:hypothetical protein